MSSDSSTSDNGTAGAKKRKSTYYVRKNELQELREQANLLQQRIQELEHAQQARIEPTHQAIAINDALHSSTMHHALVVAGARSLIESHSGLSNTSPVARYIHLPVHPTERECILDAMRDQRIHEATAFLLARSHFLDLRRHYRQVESLETERGHRISIFWDVVNFARDGLTVADVYQSIAHFMNMSEIAMSERSGPLSIRESDVLPDHPLNSEQMRVLSIYDDGFLSEKNFVMHSQLHANSTLLRQPHGVFTVDFVDRDDAHPYQPHARVRKDITSAILVMQSAPDTVSVLRWSSLKIWASPLLTRERMHRLAQVGSSAFFDTMTSVVRARVGLPDL